MDRKQVWTLEVWVKEQSRAGEKRWSSLLTENCGWSLKLSLGNLELGLGFKDKDKVTLVLRSDHHAEPCQETSNSDLRSLKNLKEGTARLKSGSSMKLNKEATGNLAHEEEHPEESRGNNRGGEHPGKAGPGKEALEGSNSGLKLSCIRARRFLCTKSGVTQPWSSATRPVRHFTSKRPCRKEGLVSHACDQTHGR